ncbi:hypothetical protein OROMI_027681 [Orobanche minor]
MSLQSDDSAYKALFKEEPGLSRKRFFSRNTGVQKHWVEKNILGAPRDQKKCRACVPCVVCDTLTAYLALQMDWSTRDVVFFSPQYPVDCMKNRREKKECGCRETTFQEVYKFFMLKGGVEESVYRYDAKKGDCRDLEIKGLSPAKKKVDKLPEDCRRVKVHEVEDECFSTCDVSNFEEMKKILNVGPVGGVVPWTAEFDKFDKECVFKQETKSVGTTSNSTKKKKKVNEGTGEKFSKQLDHAVLIIGYGVEIDTGTKFYIIKNSWGRAWGFEGYAKVDVAFFKGHAYYPNSAGVTFPT